MSKSNSTENVQKTVPEKNYFGRRQIFADYVQSDLNEEVISKILNDKWYIHQANANEIEYLYNYYKGKQPILNKTKIVRENINNKVLENNAYFAVEFKKGYVFGEPIQYVQRGDIANDEVLILNSYMTADDKQSKDLDLAEWLYIAGVAPRAIIPESDNEETPFSLYNLNPKNAFVVYENDLGNKRLFSVSYYQKDDGTKVGTIYTDTETYSLKGDIGKFKVEKIGINGIGINPILEYTLNKSRLGIIEVVMSMLNSLNNISSNDVDGLEQFVQSLVVFVNNDVDAKDFKELMDLGAVKVKSDNNMPADVKLLVNKLSFSDNKILYDKIYNNFLTIIGIPSKNDKASGGDTGQARLLGEGWTMADERAKQDEIAFKKTARQELKIILEICKNSIGSGIKNLKLKDVDIKFTRNKSDNLLTKAQSLLNLKQAQIAPDIAMTVSGLFSDPNETYYKSLKYYGEDNLWKESKNNDESLRTSSTSMDESKEDIKEV